MEDRPPKISSELFPAVHSDPGKQLTAHHETLHRQGRRLLDHTNWMMAMNGRLTTIEKRDPTIAVNELKQVVGEKLAAVRAAMWAFGIVWTVLMTVGALAVALWVGMR